MDESKEDRVQNILDELDEGKNEDDGAAWSEDNQREKENGINWKVRIRNKWFWMTAIPLVLLLVQQVLAIFGVAFDFDGIMQQLLAIVETCFLLLGLMGVAVDMTTQGYGDSDHAMTYIYPRKN